MRVLITGGFGFIGGRLGRHLQARGCHVILGTRRAIAAPVWLPQAEISQIDWSPASLSQACKDVDVVVHAAGMNAQDCEAEPIAALEFNGAMAGRLAETAAESGVKCFIALSTAHVYACPLVGEISEQTCPANPHSYAASHRAGDDAVLVAGSGAMNRIVLRLSNAFGAPVHKNVGCWTLLVNDLCCQAVKNRRMILRSSGLQHRDFIPMHQVCLAIEHLMRSDRKASGLINLGSGGSKSVLEMAQLIQRRCLLLFGFEPELQSPFPGAYEKSQPLYYRTDALIQSGFSIDPEPNVEIEGLLQFCNLNFAAEMLS